MTVNFFSQPFLTPDPIVGYPFTHLWLYTDCDDELAFLIGIKIMPDGIIYEIDV